MLFPFFICALLYVCMYWFLYIFRSILRSFVLSFVMSFFIRFVLFLQFFIPLCIHVSVVYFFGFRSFFIYFPRYLFISLVLSFFSYVFQ